MSETPGTLELIARHLAFALRPLVEGLRDLPHFKQLMYRLGWTVADLPPQFTALSTAVNTAVTKLETLREDPSADEIAELLQTIRQAYEAIQGIATAPSGVDAGAFLAEVGERLPELLLTDYLARELPRLYNLLLILNVIQLEHQAAVPGRPSFVRVRLEWSEIPRILSHPQDVPKVVYGWGTADLNVQRLVDHLSELFFAIGLPVNVEAPDRALAAKYADLVSEPPLNVAPSLVVPFWFGKVAGQRLQAAFALRELPAAGSTLPGLIIEPQIPSQFPVDFPLTETTTLRLRAGTNAGSLFGILIRPDDVSIKYPFAPGTELPPVGFGLSLEYKPEDTTLLLGRPSVSRLTMQGASVMLDLDRRDGELELRVGLSLNGLTLALATQEQDSFLAELIGDENATIPIPFTIQWSSRTGVAFAGGAGLELSQVANVRVGPLTVQELRLALRTTLASGRPPDLIAEMGASIGGRIGPVAFSIENVGLRLTTVFQDGNAGPFDLSVGFKPPTGAGLVIDASVVLGGGFLRFDPQKEEYSGILQLEIAEKISVKAIGLLSTRMPDGSKGYSLVAIIFAEGFPPIQLGLGFALTGIGGLLAIHRTFAEEALRAGLKNHTLDSVMFPHDPIRNAPQIISNLNKVFPPAAGHHLFGPMVQIAWGTPPLITAEVGVVLELGARLRLLILAQIAAILPRRDNDLVRLQMDAIGILDFDQGTAALDATLYDSRLLKKFVLTGDMAMRLKWEGSPHFALSVGGLHPAFQPPPNFPKLERIAINLSSGDNPRLRCESYFAITSNTVQFGARAELYAAAAGFSIHGDIGYDVLIQFDPFFFLAEFHAQLQLKRGSSNLFKVRVEGSLAGPRPLHLKGKATFEILWWDVSIRVDTTLVKGEKPPAPEPIDVLPRLKEALAHPDNWVSHLPVGQRPVVTLNTRPEAADILLHPLGTLQVKENVVPLNMEISRFGQAAPAGQRRFTISRVNVGGDEQAIRHVRDFFAPAQFIEMTDGEKLSRPSFEPMEAGVTFVSDAIVFTADTSDWLEAKSIEFETWILDKGTNVAEPADEKNAQGVKLFYQLSPMLLGKQARFGAAGNSELRRTGKAKYRTTIGKHKIAKEGWTIVDSDELTTQPVSGVETGRVASYSEAVQELRKLKEESPTRAARLKILRPSELARV